MRCESCGKDNPKGAAFCGQCGAKLEPVAQSNVVPPSSAPKSPEMRRPWLGLSAVILLIVIIGVSGGMWRQRREKGRVVLPSATGGATQLGNITSCQITDLGSANAEYSEAVAINDAGQIIGYYAPAPSESYQHGFMWQNGHVIDFGPIPSPFKNGDGSIQLAPGKPIAINNRGEVLLDSLGNISYLWKNGQITELSKLPGYPTNPRYVNSIGDNGQILSSRDSSDGPPFIWQDGHVVDLTDMSNVLGNTESINRHYLQ